MSYLVLLVMGNGLGPFRRAYLSLGLFALTFFSLFSCGERPRTMASVSNERYVVSAVRHQNVLGPVSLSVYGRESGYPDDARRRLIYLQGVATNADMQLLDQDILYVTGWIQDSVSSEILVLMKLDSPPLFDVSYLRQSVPPLRDTLWSRKLSGADFLLVKTGLSRPEHLLTIESNGNSREVHILGARSVNPDSTIADKLSLEVTWINGDMTKGITFDWPQDSPRFLDVRLETDTLVKTGNP